MILILLLLGKDLSNPNKSCIGHEVGRATLKDLDDDIIEAFQVACSGNTIDYIWDVQLEIVNFCNILTFCKAFDSIIPDFENLNIM